MITLIEKNGFMLILYRCESGGCQQIAVWKTTDRQQVPNAIVMIVLYVLVNEEVVEVYERLGGEEVSQNPALTAPRKALFEFSEPRLRLHEDCKLRIVVFQGSDLLPTISEQYYAIKDRSNIELCLPYRSETD
jgi:hypothetical protein